MGNKRHNRIPDPSPQLQIGLFNDSESKIYGFDTSSNTSPDVSLKYYQCNHQCFSDWEKSELKSFSALVNKMSDSTWVDIERGKGFGYTKHKDKSVLPNSSVMKHISDDLSFFEIRVTEKSRLHGFRCKSTFFLVWLDRNHQIYPM